MWQQVDERPLLGWGLCPEQKFSCLLLAVVQSSLDREVVELLNPIRELLVEHTTYARSEALPRGSDLEELKPHVKWNAGTLGVAPPLSDIAHPLPDDGFVR